MAGEKDFKKLISEMKPELQEGIYVFCSLSLDEKIPKSVNPIGIFHEKEGTTLILDRQEAQSAGIAYEYESRMITMTIHSSLEAIGFLAAITAVLAENGISMNAISAFYHDHLFIEKDKAEEAFLLLENLSKQ